MLCEKCKKNEAVVFYRENVNGKETSYALCQDCAAKLEKKGEINMNMPSFFDDDSFGVFDSIFGSLFAPDVKKTHALSSKKRCPLCNASFDELAKEGRVGYPMCYDTFADELERTISGIHQNVVHTGRAPAKLREKIDAKKKIKSLESELKQAISDERYERAAEIRDELNGLRSAEQ